jgi:CDP-diacylglycerol--glycerol-3-phosphate 3-phosphatidyltransferase
MAISLDSAPHASNAPEASSTNRGGAEASGARAASEAPSLSRHAMSASLEGSAERPALTPPRLPPPPEAVASPPAADETFWNLPNTITALRAAAVPFLLLHPLFPGERGSTAMAWLFIVAAVYDLEDGWLARRGKQITHNGKLLDPLADKLLVSTALIVLLAMGHIPLWATWMVVTIVGRELAVTGLRGIASAGGQVVAASRLGKLKTVTQNIAVGALLFHYETLGLDAQQVGLGFLFVATALTIASGYRYFADYFRSLRSRAPAGPGAG